MAAAIPRHLLETLINCPSCSQRYVEPRVLPNCGHTICSACLAQESLKKFHRSCPILTCGREISTTMNLSSDLPLNQTVMDLLKSSNFHVEACGQCQSCHKSPSFVKCSHCCLSVCFECANEHRRETLNTLNNKINTLEQESSQMNDRIGQARQAFIETRDKSLQTIRNHYTRLIEELRTAQANHEEKIERQSKIHHQELDLLVEDYKQRTEQISKMILDLRSSISEWSTVEEFQQLKTKLAHLEDDIREANDLFHERLPELKIFEMEQNDQRKMKNQNPLDSISQSDELMIGNGKNTLATLAGTIQIHHLDDSTSSASSSTHHEPVKISKQVKDRARSKSNHYRSMNIINPQNGSNTNGNPTSSDSTTTRRSGQHRAHPPVSINGLLPKTTSNSLVDLSTSVQQSKVSTSTIRLSSLQTKLDICHNEAYKKIPLAQSYDWGILAITNNDLILLYNRDKTSLVIFDANGNENERIQWSDGEIKDLAIYHDDSILILSEQKQAGKPFECKLFVCNLTKKQLERERTVERGTNCQRVTSDEKSIYYACEKGCNKSKIFIFDIELQLKSSFESGVEIRSMAVDSNFCYVLGKRREREPGRYFLEKREKNGQLMRRIDLYELNVDNMNRLIVDPVSRGVIVTDGGNKKMWAIGSEGEKKSIQYRPWPWSLGFLSTDVLVILHAGFLTFHAVNPNKTINQHSKVRHSISSAEKV